MKQLLLLLLLTCFSLGTYSSTDGAGVEIYLYEEEPGDKEIEPEGTRHLTVPILCSIDRQNGVVLSNYTGSITGYVVEEPQSGTTLISFSEEEDFIDYLFSYSGEVRIRILTEFYPLVGYVTLNNQH